MHSKSFEAMAMLIKFIVKCAILFFIYSWLNFWSIFYEFHFLEAKCEKTRSDKLTDMFSLELILFAPALFTLIQNQVKLENPVKNLIRVRSIFVCRSWPKGQLSSVFLLSFLALSSLSLFPYSRINSLLTIFKGKISSKSSFFY